MNEALDTIKAAWGRTLAGGIIAALILALVVGIGWTTAHSAPDGGSHPRTDSKPARNRLRICYASGNSKSAELNRSDLERVARQYNILKNEKPDFEDILRFNEKCKPSPTAEALVCNQEPCSQPKTDRPCLGCALWVPIRD